MELAIVGFVGLLGYVFSATDERSRAPLRPNQPPLRNAQAYPWGPGTQVQQALEEDRRATQARWEQSQWPGLTGVVGNSADPRAPQPFFASQAKQHTSDQLKQRNLELFTGATDAAASETGTFRHKREVPSLFRPEFTAAAVSSSGSAASGPFGVDMAARYVSSLKQNNVLPTEQIRVGPGLNVGPEVPATDGFHPMLRVLPDNNAAYRKNNLPGGVIPGSAPVGARAAELVPAKQRPPTFWDQGRYPTAPTRAAIDAASERPAVLPGACGGRAVGDEYYGGAGSTDASYSLPGGVRVRDDNSAAVPESNLTGAARGVGGFVTAGHDPARLDAQQREQTSPHGGMLTGAGAPTADAAFLVPNTNRALSSAEASGNPASAVEGGAARPMDAVATTLRDQVAKPSQPGIAAPALKGHTVQASSQWLDREAKRHDQLVENWVAPPLKASDRRVPGIVGIKPRLDIDAPHLVPTTPTPLAMAPAGESTGTHNKLPPTNMRLDLTVARDQLAANPLSLPVG